MGQRLFQVKECDLLLKSAGKILNNIFSVYTRPVAVGDQKIFFNRLTGLNHLYVYTRFEKEIRSGHVYV